ncbi:hypothetical protein SORBI_3005G134600 [Sorghum bicolor]|uniref:Metal transporter n=1 Tax=Sorghum bicolor TaxID=4558 RepID=A0A1Z5RIJ9_SORBI|nr:hypothetical protein SORBI_3005G134600 [Sorghum bicolor]
MEEEAGRRMERGEGDQLRGATTGSRRVAAAVVGASGGEIEIQMEAATVGSGASAAAAAASTSSGQEGDAEDGLQQTPTWKRFLAHAGPGFLISLAYLDPSNVQTDLQAGSIHKYELLWVLFFGFFLVLVIQSLAVKLGIITGRNLAEMCMYEYPKYVKYGLWLLIEVGVIAATIPGVLGTALAYNILLNIPFLAGVLICGASTFLLLGLQTYGDTSTFFLIENACAMLLVLLVNVAIVSTTGTICANTQLVDNIDACSSLTLKSTSILLKNMFGRSTSKIYGLALLASGQSNTVTTSYAGQYIMQGFSGMRKCIIFMIAPCFTVIPSLIICSVGGAPNIRQLINISAIILAFVLPFSLVPLLKFSSSCVVKVPYKNSNSIVKVAWILSVVIMGINIYFFCNSFISCLVHSELPRAVNAIISILVFPFMAAYIAALIYLAFRKVNAAGLFPSVPVSNGTEVEAWRQERIADDIGVR